jgi:type I restriction enzyme S subunit
LGNIITGKTPSTTNELFYNGDIPFIKTPDMNNSIYVIETNQNLTEAGSNNQKGKLICKNSLVVSCIGSAGVYSLVSKPSQFNQQINAITFNSEEYIYFTYGFVKGLKEKLEALGSNGATMTNVNKTKFEQIEIIIPNEDLLNNFHNKVKNNFESILNLQSQNQRLRESRDILLPRLMMGMIEV